MPLATASVAFAPLRSNLVNLPSGLASLLFSANIYAQQAIVEITPASAAQGTAPVFLGWTGLSTANDNIIEIDPVVASGLKLAAGLQVRVSVVADAPVVHTVHLEPETAGDWDVVETHAAFLETFMINQVRAINVGQIITVFPTPSSLSSLRVTQVIPPTQKAALLSPDSEVIVAPKSKDSGSSETKNIEPETPASTKAEVVRVSHYDAATRALEISANTPSFVSGSTVAVSLALPPILEPTASEEEISRARVVVAKYVQSESSTISLGLSTALGLSPRQVTGTRVLIRPKQIAGTVRAVLRPYAASSSAKLQNVKPGTLDSNALSDLGLNYAGPGLVVPPLSWLQYGGILETEAKEWGTASKIDWGSEVISAESRKLRYTDSASSPASSSDGRVSRTSRTSVRPVVGRDAVITEIVQSSLGGLGTLVYGSRGCGKSAVSQAAVDQLRERGVHVVEFHSGLYTDKAVPTVREALRKAATDAVWHAPSVVVFDDLDKLIPAQQENSGDSGRQQQLAELFSSVWRPLLGKRGVSLISTAQDRSDVHAHLLSSHLLDSVVHINAPNKELREQVLLTAMEISIETPLSTDVDLLEIVGDTEGYQPGDLWILVDRLAVVLAASDAPNVTAKAFSEALSNFVPASLRGVRLEKPKTKWDDVGGLANVKSVILETLEWPTKYAPVFANCPLRLRSGLLLYGYPGCGKTMLASAIATRTGLNFISVKGPEILNKYIGASEQSVRDLFDRAQAAKPCVLFFDEFDSIAPKRGHDSTGVTDRVVNQLLTQMDGAEGLDGVYVLAATSRPDMIDSALLRPGRLDKTLLCDMPNVHERRDIIQRAAAKMILADDVDLDAAARETEGFTGADLQALMYNAYLDAVHSVLDAPASADAPASGANDNAANSRDAFEIGGADLDGARKYFSESLSSKDPSSATPAIETATVEATHFRKALSDSKPSISPQEAARFRAIYREFVTDRNGELPPGTSSNEIGKRTTLQ